MRKTSAIWATAAAMVLMASCSDDDVKTSQYPAEWESIEINTGEETYTGGKLGTSFVVGASAYEQPTPAVEQQGFGQAFQFGEYFFERDFNTNESGPFTGLGPLYIRSGCLYCHPAYGHGKKMERYKASDMGNGYLLVVYDKQTDGYLTSLTGMPQTKAVPPFKAPIDESQIKIEWKQYTDEWGNTFDDGESYELTYPEVTIPETAYYVPLLSSRGEIPVSEVGVRLESTIGIYGTGLLDAIPDDSIKAQYLKYEKAGRVKLNPAIWAGGDWASMYKGLDGVARVKRYTYALTRSSLADGPGANAVWNITNVTRRDRKYHYMTAAYAETASKDPDVQKDFYTYFPNEKKYGTVEEDIYHYLMGKDNEGKNVAEAEMADADFVNFMVWHRGLAVPAARNLDNPQIKKGHQIFREIGCATCHRPSWTTGDDDVQDPNNGLCNNSNMPRYPKQTIWPYTDMVQHKLYMENDIRTGWCRTTPLWGRGLSKLCTGREDRLHDCRAKNVIEAIMWHGNKESDARWAVERFRKLNKEEREALVAFIDAI